MKIQYKDTSILNKSELTTLKTISEEYSEKLKSYIPVKEVVIDVKTHHKGGKRKRYTISIHVSDDRVFNTKVEDWDFSRAVYKAFKKIIHEAEHKDKIKGKPSRSRLKQALLKTKGIFKK